MKSTGFSDSARSTHDEHRQVSAEELLAAIDTELSALKEQAAVIANERKAIQSTFGIEQLPSSLDRLQAYALNAAVMKLGGEELRRARRHLHNIKARLDRLSAAIASHNEKLASRGLLAGLFNFISDLRKANHLAAAREQHLVEYHDAKMSLRTVIYRIQSPEQAERASLIAHREVNRAMQARKKLRDLAIRLRRIEDDTALRRQIRKLLLDIPPRARLAMRHKQLDRALRDPLLKTQLIELADRYR
jgi:hypothetical protein